MGNSKRNKQFVTIRVLIFVALVCAWLLPESVIIAASSHTQVSLSVVDTVGVNVGSSALEMDSGNLNGQEIIKSVTSFTSSGHGGEKSPDGAGLTGVIHKRNLLESEIVVTVIDL
jgi:hypothetical protein